jgi:hypothetical protein
MSDIYHTDIRLQLLNSGYLILPNWDKACFVNGYNTPEFIQREIVPERIKRWPLVYPRFTATGLLMRNGVAALDGDVNDPIGAEALFAIIERILPEVAAFSPTRYSEGTHKFMLFCRVDPNDPDLFVRKSSRKFYRLGCALEKTLRISGESLAEHRGTRGLGEAELGEVPDGASQGEDHKVEVFGGALTPKGTCVQCGIIGPRKHDAHGKVVSRYVWDDESRSPLWQAPLSALPLVTAKQLYAVMDAFEAWAESVVWVPAKAQDTDAAGPVYSITGETHFDTDRAGKGLTYEQLCDAFAIHGELRCQSNFIKGRSGENFKGQVGEANRHGCVAVYLHNEGTIHFPAELAPVDQAEFAQALGAATARPEAASVEDEPPEPAHGSFFTPGRLKTRGYPS